MAEDDFCDVEGGLRTYLRADAGIQAVVAQRVFFGIPDSPTFPLVVVRRVGGGDDPSEAALDQALVQFDCWGPVTASGHGDKATAQSVRAAVRKVLRLLAMQGATALDANTVCYGAVVQSDIWLPDPADDMPRYAISAVVTARAA